MSHLIGDETRSLIAPYTESDGPAWTGRGFKIANAVAACTVMALAVAIILGAQQYAFIVQGQPGPGMYPVVVGSVMLVLSAAWLVGTVTNRYPVSAETEPPPDRRALVRTALSLILVGASAFMMQPVGYPLTVAIVVALFVFIAGGRWLAALLAGVGFAAGSFLLVTTLLSVQLPTGVLRPLLIGLL